MKNYFPTHLALDQAFCNREEELKRLFKNIDGVNPVLIMSPRRYGKTSLVLNALQHLNIIFAHIDFYKDVTEKDIERSILNGIGKLIAALEKTPQRLLKLANELFASLQVKIGFEESGLALDFSRRKETQNSADILLIALEKLHELAVRQKKTVVLFMDEIQVLGEVLETHAIEAAIRHAAQKSTHVVYIFSGSNRHLLGKMFYDKKRPLYQSFDCIQLDRISEPAYEKHIQKAAVLRWNKKLGVETLKAIFKFSEKHSYYVNKLCSLLWLNDFPDAIKVKKCWGEYVLESKSLIAKELESLSLNQKKLLVELAKYQPKEIYGKDFINQVEISSGSLSQVLSVLKEKDYIFVNDQGYYQILDPLLKSVLSGT